MASAAGMSKTGMASAVAMGMMGATAIMGIMKNLFKRLVDSWPGLQASMDIISKSLQLFLRPIAMILDMFIRPLAIMLMRLAVKFFKWFQDQDIAKGGGAIAEGTPAEGITKFLDSIIWALEDFDPKDIVDSLGAVFVGIMDEMAKVHWEEKIFTIVVLFAEKLYLGLVQSVPYILYGLIKFGEMLFDGFVFQTKLLLDTLGNIIMLLWNGAGGLISWIWEVGKIAFGAIWEAISGIAGWVWESLVNIFTDIWNSIAPFGQWLWDTLTGSFKKAWEILAALGQWTLDSLKSALKSIWDAITGLASWVGTSIKDAFNKLIDSIPGAKTVKGAVGAVADTAGKVKDAVGGAISTVGKKLTGGDFILTKSGQFIEADPEDTIMARKGGFGGGGNTSVSITINALDAQSIDQRTINKLSDAIQQVLKRNLYGLSKESYGI